MELYLIDLLWCSLSILSIVLYCGESCATTLGYGRWYREVAEFGKTRRVRSWSDVPKAWFKHFYMFAVAWTGAWLVFWYVLEHGAFTRVQIGLLAISNYVVYSSEPPSMFDNILLRFMFTETERIPVSGYVLMIHLCQRLYESVCIQRSVATMSIIHYGVGFTFYFFLPLQFVSAEINEEFGHTFIEYVGIIGMLICICGQHQCIRTMAELRKTSDTIKLPRGGIFELVTSPHYTFEVFFFVFFWLGTTNRMAFPLLFTLTNQSVSALWTLEFYKSKFPDEIESRRALIPFLL